VWFVRLAGGSGRGKEKQLLATRFSAVLLHAIDRANCQLVDAVCQLCYEIKFEAALMEWLLLWWWNLGM